MDIRPLAANYSVSPQITPADIAALKAAGFAAVICNRPDGENPADLQANAVEKACAAQGLPFTFNPVFPGAMTADNITAQAAAVAAATGPVLAYCASGNRSSILWAFTQAGQLPIDEIIARGTQAGYQTAALRPQLESYASR